MKNRVILGLDVSTTTIGVSLTLKSDEKELPEIVKVTHLSPKIDKNIKGNEGLFIKNKIFKDFIQEYKKYNITDVIIEEPLYSSNNIYTVSTLLKFNGMVSNTVYNELNLVPNLISSYESRKYAFPELMAIRKFDKKGNPYPENKLKKQSPVLFGDYPWDIDKKQVVLDKISTLYPQIEWVYDKKGKLKKENFDSADSICCILGFLNKEKEEINN